MIFRPFHEAEGNGYKYDDGSDGAGAWFWWAKEGSTVYKQLWAFLQDTLQNEYGLHNLIYEQNLYAWSDDSALWYSGADRVDIAAYDKYNVKYNRHDGNTSGPNLDAESGIFHTLVDFVDGEKMVAMAENDSVPSLENLLIDHAYWLYFCPWYDSEQEHFLGESNQDLDEFSKLYNSDFCITLDELPEDLFAGSSDTTATTTAAATSEKTTTTTTAVVVTTAEGSGNGTKYGDANEDGTVNVADAVKILQYIANSEKYPMTAQGLENADCDGESGITGTDAVVVQQVDAKMIAQEDLPVKK